MRAHQDVLGPTSTLEVADPLAFDLQQAVEGFLQRLKLAGSSASASASKVVPAEHLEVLRSVTTSSTPPRAALPVLADLLELPHLTAIVAECFRPIVELLAASWLDRARGGRDEWLRRVQALALLSDASEELWPILEHLLCSSAFILLPSTSLAVLSPDTLHPILLTLLRLLALAPSTSLPRSLLPLESKDALRRLFAGNTTTERSQDTATRLLAIRSFCAWEGIPEGPRYTLECQALKADGLEWGQGELFWREGDECIFPATLGLTPAVDVSDGQDAAMGVTDADDEDTEVIVRERWSRAWVWPVLEQQRIQGLCVALNSADAAYLSPANAAHDGEALELQLSEADLPRSIRLVANVFVFRPTAASFDAPAAGLVDIHVPTSSTSAALTRLALLVAERSPALLTSSASAGKTHVVLHLASLCAPGGRSPLVLSLADTSLDPKSLLGNYVSDPVHPGNFIYTPGALAKAVAEGRWVLLEDVDKARGEVLALVGELAEAVGSGARKVGAKGRLNVPGKGTVEVHKDFRLLATRSAHPAYQVGNVTKPLFAAPTFLGHQKWTEVFLLPPTEGEIHEILVRRFPILGHEAEGAVVPCLVGAWETVRAGRKPAAGHQASASAEGRELGLRDLIKFVGRIEVLLQGPSTSQTRFNAEGQAINPLLQESIFLSALDIFFACLSNPSASLAIAVGEVLGLNAERAEWCVGKRRPELISWGAEGGAAVRGWKVGRGRLEAKVSDQAFHSPAAGRPYALTRPSLLLLEQLTIAISNLEPLLLVGETGTGKTTSVTHLAALLRRPLVSLNLSTQTESSDLLGGFKPLDPKLPAAELMGSWLSLFERTFSRKKKTNRAFEEVLRRVVGGAKWARAVEMWRKSRSLAWERLGKQVDAENAEIAAEDASREQAIDDQPSSPRKRRKTQSNEEQEQAEHLLREWQAFGSAVDEFDVQHVKSGGRFMFSYVEGPLVKALRSGDWVLLDEVNLASPETLESLASLLESSSSSLTLTERGDLEPVPRHADFRLFACMNPATDVGKKDLPAGLRARFTELYVPSPDRDRDALRAIVEQYIGDAAVADRGAVDDVAELYLATKGLANSRQLADGSNLPPHYSIRTLARALTFAAQIAPNYGLRRALWEGFLMSFTMLLDGKSNAVVRALAERTIFGGRNPKAILSQVPSMPAGATEDDVLRFGHFWLRSGPLAADPGADYVLTPSVQAKLVDLARVISTNRFPVLIQGPTSSGKTSAVEYLARRTGHRFVRINNHEHTDIQEYLGTYVSDPESGKLVFQEGVLVRAVRRGDWIVLDELNLAPTDVLEALNRLLDDNRELVIPETGEVVRPHPHFMLFATQNPPGLYGGRKVLSRAFRNRFLEVHFDDVPQAELEQILYERCRIAPSYAKLIVAVFQELQHRRQSARVFETKASFATLRDLFRWGRRDAGSKEELADHGYMLLAERARRAEDKVVVKEVLEQVLKVRIDEHKLYDLLSLTEEQVIARLGLPLPLPSADTPIVWTTGMQRLYTLVALSLKYDEPVLMVGETGCGKTSVCQLISAASRRHLYEVNCHQNMETADLLGGQKPVRNRAAVQGALLADFTALLDQLELAPASEHPPIDTIERALDLAEALVRPGHALPADSATALREISSQLKRSTALFEWHDGPLIQAMAGGELILLDEVSLADDSVLERLNSVLEPARTLVVVEKGGKDVSQMTIIGAAGFEVLATMNPGGDYGKKELSPALRNRFTEIWVPSLDNHADLLKIVQSSWAAESLEPYGERLLAFLRWFAAELGEPSTPVVGIRDILAWVKFSNVAVSQLHVTPSDAFYEAAHLTLIDGLGTLPQVSSLSAAALRDLKAACVAKLLDLLGGVRSAAPTPAIDDSAERFAIGTFGLAKGPLTTASSNFSLRAPTTLDNAMRVLRGCQLTKPILLEGSPGVGKTSLITALAVATRNHLCRINLSDQTDLADLFGSDLPVENGRPGEFAWKDAAFLTALQSGQWVLLDEMNLASQAVLEGLNAVLDHRGTVYIPELGRSFTRHPDFRIFAAQNPVGQGGGRKGLPKSFLNRFTRVHVQELTPEDLRLICGQLYPVFPADRLERMIAFNSRLHQATMVERTIGRAGSPWEFNLRDVLRWLDLLHTRSGLEEQAGHPVEHLRTIYLQRFRTTEDRAAVLRLFAEHFDDALDLDCKPWLSASPQTAQVGHALIGRLPTVAVPADNLALLQAHLSPMEALARCVDSGWLVIVSGSPASGKSSLIQSFAQLAGRRLRSFAMNSGVDTMELLGSFEQADPSRRAQRIVERLLPLARQAASRVVTAEIEWLALSAELEAVEALSFDSPTDFHARVTAILDGLLPYLDEAEQLEYRWLVNALGQLSASGDTTGRFEWVDGELVQALTAGDWLVIDNANLCSASVLDRINSLCETQGTLVLSERGSVDGVAQVLTPHPHFRLFMTLDPRHGELSRAMRNRGVEIALDDLSAPADCQRISPIARRRVAGAKASTIDTAARSTDAWTTLVVSDSLLACSIPHDAAGALPTTPTTPTSGALLHSIAASSKASRAIVQQLLSAGDASSAALSSILLADLRASTTILAMTAHLESAAEAATGLPAAFLQCQPLDPMLNAHLFSEGNAAQAAASQIVELFVRTRLGALQLGAALKPAGVKHADDLSALERSYVVAAGRTLQKTLDSVALGIYPVLKAFYDDLAMLMQSEVLLDGAIELPPFLAILSQLADVLQQLEKVTSHAELDYSSIQVITLWLARLVDGSTACIRGLSAFAPALAQLQSSIAYDAGHGQQEIWLAHLPSRSQQLFQDTVRRLSVLLQGVPVTHALYQGLRSSALSLAATGALEQLATDGSDSISALSREIEESLIKVQDLEVAASAANRMHKNLLIASSLDVVADALADPKQSHDRRLRAILAVSESTAPFPLSEMIVFQQALWSAGIAKESQHGAKKLADVWITLSWLDTPEDVEILTGSADVFRPVVLSAVLDESNPQRLGIKDLPVQDQSLKEIATVLEIRSTTMTPSRHAAMVQLLLSTLSSILLAFSTSWPADVLQRLSSISETSPALDLAVLVGDLGATSHEALKSSLQTHLVGPLSNLLSTPRDPLIALGRCWLGLAMVILQLYIPSIPIDPSAAQRAELQLLQIEEARLSDELAAHLAAETAITGNVDNLKLAAIRPRLDAIRKAIAELGAMVVERTSDVGLLNAMFHEVHEFFNEVLAPARMQNLVEALADAPDEQALMRERSAQENIVGFCRRLDQTYRFFADLHRPIVLALGQLRTGLRLICRDAELKRARQVHQLEADLVPILTAFPTALGIDRLHAADLPVRFKSHSPAVPTASLLLLGLAASVYDSNIGVAFDTGRVQAVSTLFDQFTHLWLMDCERQAQAEQEAESLYRQRKVEEDVLTDIELEEKEFKELFPQFGDVLDDDYNQDENTSSAQAKDKALKASFIQPGQAAIALQLHTALFKPKEDAAGQHFYTAARESIVRQVLERCYNALSDSVDDSLAFQVGVVLDTVTRGGSQPTFGNGRPYDYYTDANPSEMRKAVKLLNRLVGRLEDIAREWPEQMVLRHLLDRCAAMLALKADSPVVRVIAAFEGLLLHTADWEAYANRDNTLAGFQTDIGNLIVDWRRLELSCWAQLLETQALNFANETSSWWFKMYEVLVHGGRAAAQEEAEVPGSRATEAHADSLVSLIDRFMTTSPLGQYTPRLDMLRTFSRHLNLLSGTPSAFTGIDRMTRVLESLTARYTLSEPTVATSLRTQRDKIERNVKDFIKLASWKDVNVHALKASAQHTHRQLHRCIRKFREVLRKPCNVLLAPPESQRKATDGFVRPALVATNHDGRLLKMDDGSSGTSGNHRRLFEKYKTLLASSVRPAFSFEQHEVINDAAVEIVTTAKSLADETPSVFNDGTAKAVKNMLNRKRVAWGTLLKELRKMGFSNRVKAPVLALQQSSVAIHSLPALRLSATDSAPITSEVGRIEEYHYRMLVLMPELRDSLRSHHTDLTTPDLTKAVGFVESVLAVALTNRASLAENLGLFTSLTRYVARLDQLTLAAETGVSVGAVGRSPEAVVYSADRFLSQISDALRELLVGCREYEQVTGSSAASADSHSLIESFLSTAGNLRKAVARIVAGIKGVELHVLLSSEIETLQQCEALAAELERTLRLLSTKEPALRHLYSGLVNLVAARPALCPPSNSALDSTAAVDETMTTAADALVRSFLNIAKAMHDSISASPPVDTDVPTKASGTLQQRTRTLRLPAVVVHLQQLVLEASSPAATESALQRIAPFAAEYALLVQDHLFALASWTGTVFKLAHILGNLTLGLSRKGFCSPQEGDQQDGAEGDEGQTSDGTGMGAGTGEGNVSEQIEDESQVEGLQDEEPQPKDKDQKKEEGGALEMSEDFAGELEDVSADGSDGEEEDDDDKDDEDAPPDEQVGDVDPLDENAVDEKFWGDEKGEEDDSKQDEKMDQDHSKEQGNESDLVAKENEQTKKQSNKEEQPEPQAQPEDDEPNEDEDAPIQDQEADDDEEAEADEQRGPGEKMPDNVPEADTLDLPDELDLDGGEDDQEEDGGPDDAPMDDDGPLDPDQPPMDDGPDESKKQDQPQPQPDDPAGEGEGQEDLPSEAQPEEEQPDEDEKADPSAQAQAEAGEDDAVPEDEDEEPESQVAKPKLESGNEASDQPQDAQMDDAGLETGQEEASMDQQDGTKDDRGKQADAPSAEHEDDAGETAQDENASAPPPTSSESKGGEGETVPMDDSADNESESKPVDEPNPMRNLGDALKEIRKRFEQIQTPTEDDDAQPEADPAMDQGEVEYAQEDDDKDMQALGAAPEDQVQALSDLKIADEEVEGEEIAHMDVDEADQAEPAAQLPLIAPPPTEIDTAEDKALTQSEVRQRGQQKDPEQIDRPAEIEELDAPPLTEDEARALDREVEIKNTEWLLSDRASASAEAMWRLYTSVTHDLSHTLCEQLRLILEPTLATRLKGDYRSGKRLNMKKIIPYIASEFTKDKIWLRRTRPSTREYQVLLALDDSRSMAESHSVHLAYSTLALISQAMTKLEVGDIGIAKFGEAFELLHDFESGAFSDAEGAKVMSQFRFDQKATNVLSLVERSLEVLAEARQRRAAISSTSADIWQLELIISDGICQDHEKLRTLLRKAAEQRVMIVFLIVDSLHRTDTQPAGFAPKAEPEAKSKNSILNMKTAKYEVGASGQMELTMETYLDTFPFEYYVVLRDVEALPEVLSDTLRQWMERVSEE